MNRAYSTATSGFKKVTHVLFDLDGLLLDSEIIYTEVTQKVVEPYGKVYTPEIKRQIMGLQGVEVAHLIVDLLDLPISPEEYIARTVALQRELMPHVKLMPVIHDIANKYGSVYTTDIMKKILGTTQWDTCKLAVKEMKLPITPEKFNNYFNHETKLRLANVGFLPGAEKFVKHLHKNNVPIAVATSSSKESYDLKTQRHEEFFSLFHHKVTGGSDPEVKFGKPHPDIFLICASRFPDKPKSSDCLVLEDAPNGVKAAISAGMQCIMVPDPAIAGPEFQKDATLVLNSLEDLKPEVFGLPPYSS